MIHRRGFLKQAFHSVAAASLSLVLAGSLTVGAPAVFAQGSDDSAVTARDVQEAYKHKTLASDSTDPVGIQLVLAMDTSGSMSDEEFAIEMQATAYALNSQLFRNVIKYKAGDKSVAITLVDFESFAQLRIGWVDIRGDEINDKPYQPGEKITSAKPDKLDLLAAEVANLPRSRSGGTNIYEAMELSEKLFIACPWGVTERRVLDIFGDGGSNGFLVESGRNKLAAMGVTVNGFAIVNEQYGLEDFFRNYMITQVYTRSPDGIYSQPGRVWAVARFLMTEDDQENGLKSFFGEVVRGMKQKLSIEVAGVKDYNHVLASLGHKPEFPLPAAITRKPE